VVAELGDDPGRRGAPRIIALGFRLRQPRAATGGRSCGTAAPWDRRTGWRRRDSRSDIPRARGDTVSRAACRPSPAAAAIAGGSA